MKKLGFSVLGLTGCATARALVLTGFMSASQYGCSAAPLERGCTYQVTLDGFTGPAAVAEALDAMDEWKLAIPELALSVSTGICSGAPRGTICIHASDAATVLEMACAQPTADLLGVTLAVPGIDSGEVWIALERTGNGTVLAQTIAHEAGHAMGLVHPPTGNVIMRASIADAAQTVQPGDVAQWRALRE